MNGQIDWIFFAAQAKPTSIRRAIAERLAEREPVIIVDQPVSVLRQRCVPPLRDRTAAIGDSAGALRYSPLHFPQRLPGTTGLVRRLNGWLLRRELDLLLSPKWARIVCYDSPTQNHLVKRMEERLSIYLAVDDLTVDVTGKAVRGQCDAEQKMLANIDLVMCVSETLAEVLRSRAPSSTIPPVLVLPNGYDERIFSRGLNTAEPPGLRNIARPRVLVAGHISERIDWSGIGAAANLRPKWVWVFVGPADPGIQEKIHHTVGNRGFWHPPVPVTEIPGWIAHCDACAVPYRLNHFTRASYPLKLIEYLALGAPALSTRVPALQRYGSVVEWVEEGNGESYASALDRLMAAKGSDHLRRLRELAVAADSYTARAESFKKIVSTFMAGIEPPSFIQQTAGGPDAEAAPASNLSRRVSKR